MDHVEEMWIDVYKKRGINAGGRHVEDTRRTRGRNVEQKRNVEQTLKKVEETWKKRRRNVEDTTHEQRRWNVKETYVTET